MKIWNISKFFEDDVILGENAEVFLNQNEWLKTRFDFNDIFIIRLETFLQPVKLEKQTKIPPFNSRNFDILKINSLGDGRLYYFSRCG